MPSLKQAIADKKRRNPRCGETRRSTPNWKVIGENPKLVEYYNGLSKR